MDLHRWIVEQFVKMLASSGNWTVEKLRDDEAIKTAARVFYIAMPRVFQALIELKGGQAWFEGFALKMRDGLLVLSPAELAALGIGHATDATANATLKLIGLTKGAAAVLPAMPALPAMPTMPDLRNYWPFGKATKVEIVPTAEPAVGEPEQKALAAEAKPSIPTS